MLKKIKFDLFEKRLGPDLPFTHWALHFSSLARRLCLAKFGEFGDGSVFRPGAFAVETQNIFIGSRIVIRPGTMLFADEFASITIGEGALIGSGVHVYVNNHRFDGSSKIIDQGYYPSEDVKISSGSWVGANAIILPGVEIGENAVVAAGAVVTEAVPNRTIVAGVPAKKIREV